MFAVVVAVMLGAVQRIQIELEIEAVQFFDQAMRKKYRMGNYYIHAPSCLDQAILMIAHDYFLEITEPHEIPKYFFTIISIEKEGDVRNITARGDFKRAYSYRKAQVKLKDHGLDVIQVE